MASLATSNLTKVGGSLFQSWHGKIEILTDVEQSGLRVKAVVGAGGTDRALAIKQLVEVALSHHAAADVAVISMLEDPSSSTWPLLS